MSAAGNITSCSATSLPFDVMWSEGFTSNTAMIEQEDSCHCSSSSSVVHNGFTADTGYTDVTRSCCLSSDGLGLNTLCSSLATDVLTLTEPYCNSRSAYTATCISSVSDSALLTVDNISHPVSSVSQVFYRAANGVYWIYDEEAMLKQAVGDCSVIPGSSPSTATASSSCTGPLFSCDDHDDDDSSVDRLVIDINDRESETTNDDLQSIVSSVDNVSVCDNFDKCSLLSEQLAICENVKPEEDLSETLVDGGNSDGNSSESRRRLTIEVKPVPEAIKFECELSPTVVEAAKPANLLTEEMYMRWPGVSGRIGAGLQNLGNTCFVNATVQCLTYTVPLVNYLLTLNHSASCTMSGMCLMCELEQHVRRCFDNSGSIVKPQSILQMLKMIARHMRWGRQEDAHEFLRYMVEAMHKSCVNGHQTLPQTSKSREKSVVNEIFGGYLRSQVTCLQCHAKSNTFDPFLDISLDVKNVSSVARALERFSEPEILDTDNAYICIKCKSKVRAQKRFTLHKLPNVLTIQLKRYGVMGGKVTRHIVFPEVLDVQPYMSRIPENPQPDDHRYRLYGVLVHEGPSTSSGHYYCYVMTADGSWYCMNDHIVRKSSLSQVLNAEAYMLFYKKGVALAAVTQDDGSLVPHLSANSKTRAGSGVDGVRRCQRSSGPGCLSSSSSSRLTDDHHRVTGVAMPRLVPANGVLSHKAIRKSACVGGQSLATSAAKRLLARPACRGGRMMPEQSVKHRAIKKKPKRPRAVVEENLAGDKFPSEPALLSVSRNVALPVAATAKQKPNENTPAPPLPRIVIKICQGRIVYPSVGAFSSASSLGDPSKCRSSSSTVDGPEIKPADPVSQRTVKSDRLKASPVFRPSVSASSSASLIGAKNDHGKCHSSNGTTNGHDSKAADLVSSRTDKYDRSKAQSDRLKASPVTGPSVSTSSSASSVGTTDDSSKCQSGSGTSHSPGLKPADPMSRRTEKSNPVSQRTDKSDRLKASPVSRLAKAISTNKPNPKVATSQSPSKSSSTKVLADRKSGTALYFDSTQLQNDGSFDKLSLDCCMKLYSQLNQPQTSSHLLQSENAKLLKHTSQLKPRDKFSDNPRKSHDNRSSRVSKSKKHSADRVLSSVVKHLPKIPTLGSGNSVGVSAPSPQKCTVHLDRIRSVSNFSVSVCQSPSASSSQPDSSIRRRLSFCREEGVGGGVHDLDNPMDDSCSAATLTPQTNDLYSDALLQQNVNVPSATETVPGLPISLFKPRQTFSARSHTVVDGNPSIFSGSPKKSHSASIASGSNSFERSHTSILSSLLTSSVDDNSKSTAVGKRANILPGSNISHLGSATDGGDHCRFAEVHGAAVRLRNSTNIAPQPGNGSASCVELSRSSETSARRKRGMPTDTCSLSSFDISSISKKSRTLQRILGEGSSIQSNVKRAESDIVDEVASFEANQPAYLPSSVLTYDNATATQNLDIVVPVEIMLRDSEQLSSDVMERGSLSHSPCTADQSSSPLRLRLRRRADDVRPVTEIYNVIGQPGGTDSTPVAPSGYEDNGDAVFSPQSDNSR